MVSSLLFIFIARIMDVSLSTIRVLMLTRGKRLLAAFLGFFEVSIYITALSQVVQQLDSPLKILIYALGPSCGTIVGGFLEEKLAIGYALVQVIPKNHFQELVMALRAENFGVTILEGKGRNGSRSLLNIILRRKNLPRFTAIIDQVDPESFFTILDARSTKGGYIIGDKKK
ncbi:MAG TPA: DUF2179 domain-containing protein [Firmicutes bacterium]|nr:DUF2179 domain-containing protein [Bacillota bacterium]